MFLKICIFRLLGALYLALFLSCAPAFAAGDSPFETPVLAASQDGVNYTHAPDTPHIKTVTQGALRAVVDWESFNIGEEASVHFNHLAGSGSITVNRITGGGTDPSKILGKLTADGTVVILDPNGVIFDAQAVIDVGGIIASTGRLANKDEFLAGNLPNSHLILDNMDGARADAFVQNLSHNFTVRDAGLAAFVAPVVKNSGTITARLGHITLASGRHATLDLYGDRLIHITAPLAEPLPPGSTQVENTGRLIADGGRIALTARAAAGVVDKAINTSGILSAQKASMQNGKIVLSAAEDVEDIRENSILIGTSAKIQNAVDMAHADGTTTIHLQAGNYEENLVIDKSVTLNGPIFGTAAIVSTTDDLTTVHVTAPNVTLSHLALIGGLHNLLAEVADGLTLLSVRLQNSVLDAIHLINTSTYRFLNDGFSQESTPDTNTDPPDNNRIFTKPIFGSFPKNTPDTPALTTAESLAQIAPAAGDENCEGSTTGCAE